MLASLTSSALFLSLAASPPAPASTEQAATQKPVYPYESRYGLSLSAGSTSGLGIGIRKHFPNRWGFNVAAVPFIGKNSGFASLGAQVTYSFFRARIARLYVFAGVHGIYHYENTTQRTMVPAPPEPTQVGPAKQKFIPGPEIRHTDRSIGTNFGPGLGVELHFSKRFSWALELPLAIMIEAEKNSHTRQTNTQTRVLPIPNTSITLYY